MIISASRRTDIPAFYSDWFFERIREGFVCVRNPMNYHQVSRIDLSPDVVDAIVFWTKDPSPMLDRLDLLKNYKYCFQFTLTSYGTDVEENVPNKGLLMIPTFKRLSEKLTPGRVIWRYDPILLSEKYTVGYHLDYFGKLAAKLSGFTEKCVVSFLDIYKNTRLNLESIGLRGFSDEDIEALEEKIARLDEEMMANATNSVKLGELMREKEQTEAELEEKMDRWVYLNDLAEQIEAQKNS